MKGRAEHHSLVRRLRYAPLVFFEFREKPVTMSIETLTTALKREWFAMPAMFERRARGHPRKKCVIERIFSPKIKKPLCITAHNGHGGVMSDPNR
jgi:hypothetical protein